MKTAHKIELDPGVRRARYFVQACGTDRFTWNWALAEWERHHALQLKPGAMALKKQFNAMKYDQFPWLKAMHRDSHAEPLRNLGKIRHDFTHKLSTKVCRENQAITIEDLGVQAMTASAEGTKESPGRNVRQKAGLNRAMLDVAPGEIKRQFICKAKRFDNDLTLADRLYPSSQLCSTKDAVSWRIMGWDWYKSVSPKTDMQLASKGLQGRNQPHTIVHFLDGRRDSRFIALICYTFPRRRHGAAANRNILISSIHSNT